MSIAWGFLFEIWILQYYNDFIGGSFLNSHIKLHLLDFCHGKFMNFKSISFFTEFLLFLEGEIFIQEFSILRHLLASWHMSRSCNICLL